MYVALHDQGVVDSQSVGRDRSFTGTAKSTQESRLSFKVSGTATSVPAQIGQQLRKGDLIAQLDSANFTLQVEQAQAALVEAQAGERNAQSNYERTKGLYANSNASLNASRWASWARWRTSSAR